MRRSPGLRVLVFSIAILAIAACGTTVPAGAVDVVSASLFVEYGIEPTGATTSCLIEDSDPTDEQWALPLEASRSIGLDFAGLAGRTLELRTTPVSGRDPVTRAHVLVAGGRAVGAWISQENASGVRSLADRP